MDDPNNLNDCMDVAIETSLPIMLILHTFGIVANESEVEGLFAEKIAQCMTIPEVVNVASVAPSARTLQRAFNRSRGELEKNLERKGDPETVKMFLGGILNILEKLSRDMLVEFEAGNLSPEDEEEVRRRVEAI